ncbi:putative transporter, partial [Pseudoloma neurophilia]
MYSKGEKDGISPLFVTYLTHSIIICFIVHDLIKNRSNYLNYLKNIIRIKLKAFFWYTIGLSFIFNLSHIPKYMAMNKLSDVFIVSVGCLSVHTAFWLEYLFLRGIKSNQQDDSLNQTDLNQNRNFKKCNRIQMIKNCLLTLLSILATALLFLDECHDFKQLFLGAMLIFGSICDGFYTVFLKVVIKKRRAQICKENNIETDQLIDYTCLNNNLVDKKPFQKQQDILDIQITTINYSDGSKRIRLPSRNTVKSTRRNHVSVFDEQITTDGFCVNSTENMKFEHAQVLSNPQDDPVKNTNKRFSLISVDKYLVGLCPTGVSFDKIDNLIFMRQYLGLTGLITFLFYWPM